MLDLTDLRFASHQASGFRHAWEASPCRPAAGPASGFMFATGIENSAPTVQGGRERRDQMAELGQYARWREDFHLVRELGASCATARNSTPLSAAPGCTTGPSPTRPSPS